MGKFEAAARDLTELIRLDPSNARHYELRAEAYIDMGQFDAAIADLDKAVELEPDSWHYRERGKGYLRIPSFRRRSRFPAPPP